MNNQQSTRAQGQQACQNKQNINLRGAKHYYEWIGHPHNSGSKPVMVFIHGWGGSARYWQSTAQALSDSFDCLLYDLRGFGRSATVADDLSLTYELEEYAEDLAQLLDALHLDEVYLHSHSMGASIGILFLDMYPERIKQAILVCNGIFEYDARAFALLHKLGGYVVKFRYPWFLQIPWADKLFIARFLHRPLERQISQNFLADFLLADYNAAVGTIYTSVNKKTVEEMPTKFAQIQVPTLMISGEKDQIIPAAMGKQAAELNEMLEYVEIKDTAHFPMLEDEKTYLQVVREFLAKDSEHN